MTKTPEELLEILHPPETSKRCTKCREWLPLESFSPNPKIKSGRSSWCRSCHVEATRKWRTENPGYVEGINAARRVKHPARACVECGGEFIPNRIDRLVCGGECRSRRHTRLGRERRDRAEAAWSERVLSLDK